MLHPIGLKRYAPKILQPIIVEGVVHVISVDQWQVNFSYLNYHRSRIECLNYVFAIDKYLLIIFLLHSFIVLNAHTSHNDIISIES